MDVLTKQSRETQAVIGAAVLYLVFSFFHWQSVDGVPGAHASEWEGIGVVAGLLVVALLLWEAARLFEVKVELGSLSPGLISLGLALLLLVFTVITFLSHDEFRKLPAWIGLILSIVIAAAAWMRAKAEGVQMPDMTAARASGSSSTGSATSGAPPEPAAPAQPAAPASPPSSPADREPPAAG